MWCKHCRKKVADGLNAADPADRVCPECGQHAACLPPAEAIRQATDFSPAEDPLCPAATSGLRAGNFDFDTWELDQDLLDAERFMVVQRRAQTKHAEQSAARRARDKAALDGTPRKRPWSPQHDFASLAALSADGDATERQAASPAPADDALSAWCCRAVGWTLLAFGGALVWLWWTHQRADLGSLGWPVALSGLALLLAGRMIRRKRRRMQSGIPPRLLWPGPPPAPHYVSWIVPGQAGEYFFPHIQAPQTAVSEHDRAESQRMLLAMKEQLDRLSARLDRTSA